MPKLDTKKLKFSLPERRFARGERRMVSQRWPVDLITEIDRIAADWGWNSTEIAITCLDQFVQWARDERRTKR